MTAKSLLPHDIPIGGLTSIIFRTQAIFLNHHLRSHGLSYGQFPVLMFLRKHQNVTQETLARHFHIDRGTIARSVKKLEDAGYVIRKIDPDNRRAVKLFLSEKGSSIISDLIRIDTEWETTASSGLNEEEKVQFKDLLWRVAFASIKGVDDIGENSFIPCCAGGDCA